MLSRLGFKLAARSFTGTRSLATATNKIYNSPKEAIADMKDGATVAMGGFGIVGIPENGVLSMVEKGLKNIRIVSNVAGIPDWGIGLLLKGKQWSK
jgi:3-oxoacid CoA-transferase subunit A